MVFDIKMKDFRHKAKLVAGGNITNLQATTKYTNAILIETFVLH